MWNLWKLFKKKKNFPWKKNPDPVVRSHLSSVLIVVLLRPAQCFTWHPPHPRRQVVSKVTNLNSSISSRIMFRMKWNCREVSGAAPSCPTTSVVFWDSEDTATAAAGPEALNRTRLSETSGPRPPLLSPWKQSCTCCGGGRSPEDRRIVAQLDVVSFAEAGLWS